MGFWETVCAKAHIPKRNQQPAPLHSDPQRRARHVTPPSARATQPVQPAEAEYCRQDETPTAAMHAPAAAHGHANAGRPSPSWGRGAILLPVRVRLFSDGAEAVASGAPLRVGLLPQPRALVGCCFGGRFAPLETADGVSFQLPWALRRKPSDHQKRACPEPLKAAILSTMSMLAAPLEVSAATCQPANSFTNMPLFIAVALVGAAVGGLLARQRKEELKRLNNQLRQINTALRRQAQIESFAPGLTYAPVRRTTENDVIVDPRKQQLATNIRNGKNYLRNQDLDKAVTEFRMALDLAESIGDHFEEKKAARGLGASLQRLGKYRDAMRCYSKVLELSKETGEDSGCTEAYGAIADCYAELGDLERAAKVYDKYISRLQPGE